MVAGLVSTRHEYYRVYDIYIWIGIGVFAVILLAVLFLVVSGARRPPHRASRRFKNDPLEGSYALLLSGVVAFLLWLTFTAEHQTDTVSSHERPALTIKATGAKWEWTFQYPSYGITVRSGTAGISTLVLPSGEPVRFVLTSVDVIHAFWVPEIRYKHDLIPGAAQYATLDFAQRGLFPAECAEFCGLRHSDMVFNVEVVSPARFLAWARSGGRMAVR